MFIVVHETPLKYFSKRKETKIERKHDDEEKYCLTLKARQKKVYPFLVYDVGDILEQLLEKQLIQLSKCINNRNKQEKYMIPTTTSIIRS